MAIFPEKGKLKKHTHTEIYIYRESKNRWRKEMRSNCTRFRGVSQFGRKLQGSKDKLVLDWTVTHMKKSFNAHWQHRVCQNTLLPRRRPGDLGELKSAAFLWQFFCYWESDHTHVPWKMRLSIYQNTRREETIVLIPREQTAARWWFRNSPLPPFRLPHTDLWPSRCCMACHTGRIGKENHDFEPKPV